MYAKDKTFVIYRQTSVGFPPLPTWRGSPHPLFFRFIQTYIGLTALRDVVVQNLGMSHK